MAGIRCLLNHDRLHHGNSAERYHYQPAIAPEAFPLFVFYHHYRLEPHRYWYVRLHYPVHGRDVLTTFTLGF